MGSSAGGLLGCMCQGEGNTTWVIALPCQEKMYKAQGSSRLKVVKNRRA